MEAARQAGLIPTPMTPTEVPNESVPMNRPRLTPQELDHIENKARERFEGSPYSEDRYLVATILSMAEELRELRSAPVNLEPLREAVEHLSKRVYESRDDDINHGHRIPDSDAPLGLDQPRQESLWVWAYANGFFSCAGWAGDGLPWLVEAAHSAKGILAVIRPFFGEVAQSKDRVEDGWPQEVALPELLSHIRAKDLEGFIVYDDAGKEIYRELLL